MKISESFYAYGHEKIKSSHRTTFEITKENYLTERGDCIIAVKSEKACSDLKEDLKQAIRKPNSKVLIHLELQGLKETVEAYGSEKLILTSPVSIVIRKSNYIDERTLAINSNKAAVDIDRKLIEALKFENSRIKITIEVITFK
ncbi:MAG: DUF371 domain-containing protein [Thermoproteota archaeon]|jgi:Uncharacterized protein conserved in archaea